MPTIPPVLPLRCALAAVASTRVMAATVYVDDDAPPRGDGASWATSHRFLAEALSHSRPGDEIRVAQGIYFPDRSETDPTGSGDRAASFVLVGVDLRGGFAGFDSPNPDLSDPAAWPTVLSGDLAGNNDQVDPADPFDQADPAWLDNARHVVRVVEQASSLSGVTITHGNADIAVVIEWLGSGLQAIDASVTIEGCRFIDNLAGGAAAMYVYDTQSVVVQGCEFSGNRATASMGGALGLQRIDDATIADCLFIANSSAHSGGGVLLVAPLTGAIERCEVLDNTSGFSGGGVQLLPTSTGSTAPVVTLRDCIVAGNVAAGAGGVGLPRGCAVVRCLIADNWASAGGGGIYCLGVDEPAEPARVVSCSVVNNGSAFIGGGIAMGIATTVDGCFVGANVASVGGGMNAARTTLLRHCTLADNAPSGLASESTGSVQLLNSILWGNALPGIAAVSVPGVFVQASIVEGGWTGPGVDVLDVDPLFADPGAGDIRLLSGSPAIGTADLALIPADTVDLDADGDVAEPLPHDLLGGPRVVGGTAELGAIEGAIEPSTPADSEATLPIGEPVILAPESPLPWVVDLVSAELTNLSGPAESTAALAHIAWSVHRGAGGFSEEGPVARLDTSIAPGAHMTRIRIPLNRVAIQSAATGELRVTVYDDDLDAWRLAVSGNAGGSPGHQGAIGDFFTQIGSIDAPPPLSDDVGDHGIFIDVYSGRGFAWANVDRAGDFGVGRSACALDLAPAGGDGIVDGYDLGALLAAWGGDEPADLDGSGEVDATDLGLLLAGWGGCLDAPLQDSACVPPRPNRRIAAGERHIPASLDGANLGRRLAEHAANGALPD